MYVYENYDGNTTRSETSREYLDIIIFNTIETSLCLVEIKRKREKESHKIHK